MPKLTGTFEPLGDSDRRMHGRPALLVCGYAAPDRRALLTLLETNGLRDLGAVFVGDEQGDISLEELARAPAGTGQESPSSLPRAIVMSGLTEKQLNTVMAAYRSSGMPPQLWAAVTEQSKAWPIRFLLEKLSIEKEALRAAVRKHGKKTG